MPRLYHVSRFPNVTTLIPKAPQNILTHYGLEDGVTKRVSFAPSIAHCLRGIGQAKTITNKDLFVYSPVNVDQKYLLKPKPDQVPDVRLTNEYWYLRPVNVKLVAVIRGGKVIDPRVYFIGGPKSPLFSISNGYEYQVTKRYRNRVKK